MSDEQPPAERRRPTPGGDTERREDVNRLKDHVRAQVEFEVRGDDLLAA